MSPWERKSRSREGPRGRKRGPRTPGELLQRGLVILSTDFGNYIKITWVEFYSIILNFVHVNQSLKNVGHGAWLSTQRTVFCS